MRIPGLASSRRGNAQVVAVIVAVLVVAGGGVLAWYFLDQPRGDKKEPLADAAEKTKPEKRVSDKTLGPPRPPVITNSIDMKLANLPAGKFRMGSPNSEKGRNGDEGPVHEVEITKPFYIGVHEVTQQQFARIMGRNPSAFSFERGNQDRLKDVSNTLKFPVDSVTWNEAVEFCEKLSQLIAERNANRVYRLPTEAEWEYACRAGAATAFAAGASLGGKQANCNGQEPYGDEPVGPSLPRTCNVGSYTANAFGLFDMHGNVYEWCQDWYAPYAAQAVKDPTGPEDGEFRILRGGSWHHGAQYCRSAARLSHLPSRQEWYIGFRVAMSK